MIPVHSLLFAAALAPSPAFTHTDIAWSEATESQGALPIPRQIYLNPCSDGCTVEPGASDSLADTSSLITDTSHLRAPGIHGDKWQQIVDCVAGAFAPFEVEVTDDAPTGPHVELMFGLHPVDLVGLEILAAGVAPTACHPLRAGLAFAFHIDDSVSPKTLCRTATQEIGHVLGLDHAMECADPMSYLAPRAGSVAFPDLDSACGESEARQCACGESQQNSHHALVEFFGPRGAPQIEILEPAPLSRVQREVLVRVDVLDEDPIDYVAVEVTGAPALAQIDHQAPFEFEMVLPAGTAEITILARDSLGVESVVALQVEVVDGDDSPGDEGSSQTDAPPDDPAAPPIAGCAASGPMPLAPDPALLALLLLGALGAIRTKRRGDVRAVRSSE